MNARPPPDIRHRLHSCGSAYLFTSYDSAATRILNVELSSRGVNIANVIRNHPVVIV
jgi:hypothetical protein